jgi:hypothetical protein
MERRPYINRTFDGVAAHTCYSPSSLLNKDIPLSVYQLSSEAILNVSEEPN